MKKRVVGIFAIGLLTMTATSAMATPPKVEVQEVAATGSMPKGASLSPDGTRFYVTNFGQRNKKNITVYDARTLAEIEQIDVPGIVVESVLSHDGKSLYVSNFERDTVMIIDVASKSVTHEIHAGRHPKILTLSPDGKTLFAANWASNDVTEMDVPTATVVRTLAAGKAPRGMAVARDGTLYIANFWGDSIDIYSGKSRENHHRVAACKVPRHLALSPDQRTLYISCYTASQIQAMDLETERVVHAVAIGNAPKSIDVSRDGRYVYSADYGNTNSISVVDTSDWSSRIFTIPGMDRGSGVVVTPDGHHALVTGWYDNHVYLVGFEGTGGHPKEARAAINQWIHKPKFVEHGGES